MSPKLQNGHDTDASLSASPSFPTPASTSVREQSSANKRPTTSPSPSSPRRKVKLSKTSAASTAPIAPVVPPKPPPTSKWKSAWSCTNCLNHNKAANFYCEFCGFEQPDPATNDSPIIIDDENVTSISKALGSKGNNPDDAIDLISSDEEEENEVEGASANIKTEHTPVGFGEADQPPDVIEVERPDWAPPLATTFNMELSANKSEGFATKPALSSKVVESVEMEDGEELVVLYDNSKNSLDMPHSRCDCIVKPFCKGRTDYSDSSNQANIFLPSELHENTKYCPQCYCFVCQTQAPCAMWTKGKLPHCNASQRQVAYKRARQFHSDPFKDLIMGCIPTRSADDNSLLHPMVSNLLSDVNSHARSIDRLSESYQIGRQERSASSSNPFASMMAQLMGIHEDSEDESGDYVHSFTSLYNMMKNNLQDLESAIASDDGPDAEFDFLSTCMRVRIWQSLGV